MARARSLTTEGQTLEEIRDKLTYMSVVDGQNTGFTYDYAVRRSGGRLLALIDFTLNKDYEGWPVDEFDLGYIIVEGTTNYSIVRWADEGLPQPESTGSPYVLKIVVPAGGTIYVRIPVKARFFRPFSAYITVYNRDYELEYSFYASLGGLYNVAIRNKPPKRLRLPANTWGRFITHWFMEAHHGAAEVDVEIYNPNSVDVTMYVGMVSACEIGPYIKGYAIIIGWESGFYVPLNNETFDWSIDVMYPVDIAEVAYVSAAMGIQSDDGTTISGEIYLHPGARLMASGSTTTSTGVSRDMKIWQGRHGYYPHPTVTFEFKAYTSGTGRVTSLLVTLRGFARENTYQKYIDDVSVAGGATVELLNYWNDVKHIVGATVEVVAPSDGDIWIKADTPEGEIDLCKVPANTTATVTIEGRYYNLKVYNAGTSAATVRAKVLISESILIK